MKPNRALTITVRTLEYCQRGSPTHRTRSLRTPTLYTFFFNGQDAKLLRHDLDSAHANSPFLMLAPIFEITSCFVIHVIA